MTGCHRQRLLFQGHGGRDVTAASDGGGLLLREVEERFGIVRSFAGCFTDDRDPDDSGFCRDSILRFCEENGVDYVLGLAKNNRLLRELDKELEQAREQFQRTGAPARLFNDFTYRTLKSWNRARRVSLSEAYPYQELFERVLLNLRRQCPYPIQV